jgi:hypothetical protein
MTDGSYRTKRYYLDHLLPLEQAYASGSMDLRKEKDAGLQDLPLPHTLRPETAPHQEDVIVPQTGQPLAKRRAVSSLPATQLPCSVQAEALVGCRVGVFWPEEQTYFFGSVTAYEPNTGRHVLMYDDGDSEVLELNKEIWVLISNAVTEGSQLNIAEDETLALPQATAVQSAAAPKAILIGGPSCVALDKPISTSGDAISQGDRYSVFKTRSGMPGFEVYVDIDDFALAETTVLAYRRGAVLVKAESAGGRGETFELLVELPERVDPASAQALLTPAGLLYVRVGLEKTSGNVTNMERDKGTRGL